MARSVNELYEHILEAKEAETALNVLNSTSKVAVWRLWAYITAVAIATLEQLFDVFRLDIVWMLENKSPGSLPWYREKAMMFRPGHAVTFESSGRPVYHIADEEPLFIKECSVRETSSGLVIKVVKSAGDGLAPLSPDEMSAFAAYMSAIKYAGTPVRYISGPAVLLNLELEVCYDPAVLRNDGRTFEGGTEVAVEAIRAHLRTLPYDGRLMRNDLIAQLRKVNGIVDVTIRQASTMYDNQPAVPLDHFHIPQSGWFDVNSISIHYIPHV